MNGNTVAQLSCGSALSGASTRHRILPVMAGKQAGGQIGTSARNGGKTKAARTNGKANGPQLLPLRTSPTSQTKIGQRGAVGFHKLKTKICDFPTPLD